MIHQPNASSLPTTQEGVTPTLPPELWRQLEERAAQLGIAPHDLLRLLVEDFLRGPDTTFRETSDYIFTQYEALLRRLA